MLEMDIPLWGCLGQIVRRPDQHSHLICNPFGSKVNRICIVTGTFTNNSVISLEMEMCNYRNLESSMGNDRLCFHNSAALLSRYRSVTGEGKSFVRQIAHNRL
jgi:hypothetical protein